jgi:hypothetical protein
MFIDAYGMSPGMMTAIPGVGAKYLEATRDSRGMGVKRLDIG